MTGRLQALRIKVGKLMRNVLAIIGVLNQRSQFSRR